MSQLPSLSLSLSLSPFLYIKTLLLYLKHEENGGGGAGGDGAQWGMDYIPKNATLNSNQNAKYRLIFHSMTYEFILFLTLRGEGRGEGRRGGEGGRELGGGGIRYFQIKLEKMVSHWFLTI